ncbi:MAG: hypothetical protein RNU03_01255 [Candidatus Sedimenticola sp. (ex Thyasira tokunagai)]
MSALQPTTATTPFIKQCLNIKQMVACKQNPLADSLRLCFIALPIKKEKNGSSSAVLIASIANQLFETVLRQKQ